MLNKIPITRTKRSPLAKGVALYSMTWVVVFLFAFFLPTFRTHAATVNKLPTVGFLTSGLVGYWTMDGSDTTWTTAFAGSITDKSGNGATGTFIHFGQATSTSVGKIGQALRFNGATVVNGGTEITLSGPVLTSTHSISLWINPSTFATANDYKMLFGQDNNHGVFFRNSGKIDYYYSGAHLFATVLSLNKWSHVVAICNAGALTLYVNGVLDANSFTGCPAITPALIGNDPTESFAGLIDDIRAYNRALSASEVSTLYGAGAAKVNISPTKVLKTGLTAYWTFDAADVDNTFVYDRSGNARNAYVSGVATSSAGTIGKIGRAFNFDGVNTKVFTAGTAAPLITTTNATISAWVKPTGTSSTCASAYQCQSIVEESSTANFDISRGTLGGNDRIWAVNWSSGSETRVGIPYTNDQWVHVVWLHTGGVLSAYKNGVFVASTTSGTTDAFTGILNIGNGSAAFKGAIDDVRTYNRALSATEILALYNSGAQKANASQASQQTSGLVGLWTFDGKDISNGVALDRSGNGNNGNLINIATSTFYTIGKVGQAFNFNDNATINIANSYAYTAGNPLSVSAWAYSTSYTNSSGNYPMVFSGGSGKMELRLLTSTGRPEFIDTVDSATAASPMSLNTWHYLTGVYDGAKLYIYVDGVLQTSINHTSGTQTLNITIGGRTSSNFLWKGKIDEVRMYNRALSASEIQQLYLRGK